MAYVSPTARAVGDPVTASDQNIVAADLADGGWVTPTLLNSWVSFDGGATYTIPKYRVIGPWVTLAGLMKLGTSTTTVFTLPVGARPLKQITFAQKSGTSVARVDVFATGVIQVVSYDTGASNGDVSLNGITFIAEQ